MSETEQTPANKKLGTLCGARSNRTMKVSFECSFPGFSDSRLQRLVEEQQLTLTCGLLALVVQRFISNEWDDLTDAFSTFASTNDWPQSAPDCLLNLMALYHLRRELVSLSQSTNFGNLRTIIDSLPPALLMEIAEGLLSAFQDRLSIITLTSDDITQAFEKYGTRTGKGSFTGYGSLTKDALENLRFTTLHLALVGRQN
jgi:hypothetical protein